jgi:hypothetical protein
MDNQAVNRAAGLRCRAVRSTGMPRREIPVRCQDISFGYLWSTCHLRMPAFVFSVTFTSVSHMGEFTSPPDAGPSPVMRVPALGNVSPIAFLDNGMVEGCLC